MERPRFDIASTLFNTIYLRGTEQATLAHVAQVIGGKVKYNIEAGIFTNSCALRLSYVLNYSGILIPFASGKTSSGSDGKWYIPRVKDLVRFLEDSFGAPDQTLLNPSPDKVKEKGILVFEVNGWSDASGHATLWGGAACSDSCYFGKASKTHLWTLK